MAEVIGKKLDYQEKSYVEGVGNEILLGLGASLAIFLPIIISVVVRKSRNIQIHPGEVEHVQATRERLGVGENQIADDSANAEGTERRIPPRNMNDGEPCPICLMQPRLLVITNCGHGFCGLCLITYWQTRSPYHAMTCPVCRQQITMIFMDFPEDDTTEEATNIRNSVNRYNRQFSSEPRTILEHIQDLPTLLQRLFHEFFSITGLVTVLRLRIMFCFLAAILYFVSPIDILPEAAFGILGFFDDIVVFLLLLVYVTEIYRNFVANRAAAALT